MDDQNRLTAALRGDESGGSITLDNFYQEWTLEQTGNWELFKNDLNGDNDWVDTNELNDDRTHNAVNELTARDTDDNGIDNYTLTYTAAGQLDDDAQHFEYIYDAWGRLVEIENQSSVTVAAFEYNGLGHRIGHQWDKDADTDLDQQRLVYDVTAASHDWASGHRHRHSIGRFHTSRPKLQRPRAHHPLHGSLSRTGPRGSAGPRRSGRLRVLEGQLIERDQQIGARRMPYARSPCPPFRLRPTADMARINSRPTAGSG